jgi:cyclopropane-fatty-acyl-phospholipid synthase
MTAARAGGAAITSMGVIVPYDAKDLPTDYFRLFLDSRLNHSSGYFEREEMTLDEAQLAKVDSILASCRLRPSLRLLDVGCGWGAAAQRAMDRHDVDVVGITIERPQFEHAAQLFAGNPRASIRLQSWEEFHEPVDRIICINAFENFKKKDQFFAHCRKLLPAGGVMAVLTVTADRPVFRVTSKSRIIELAREAGFEVSVSDSLALHYARTLDCFVAGLNRNRARAIALASQEVVERNLRFYTKSAEYLRSGTNDMFAFACYAT